MIQNIEYFIDNAKKIGFDLTQKQIEQFSKYYDLVIENNKLFNLTAITDEIEFIDKHYIDSLLGISEIPNTGKLLDIGSGAGFPSIPIAIMCPDLEIIALDSTAKKMHFVEESAKKIGLTNIKTIVGRAEELTGKRNAFDCVTARAVASLNILLELAIPLLKINGLFVAYKTDESELKESINAIRLLDSKHLSSKVASLPNGDNRAILVFKKCKDTDSKYPRQYGTIKKKPL